MKMYVAGGIYEKEGKEYFGMVKPSGKNSLPYIFDGVKKRTHTEHHAHLYFIESANSLRLAKKSWEAEFAGVKAPLSVIILDEEHELLAQAIEMFQKEIQSF